MSSNGSSNGKVAPAAFPPPVDSRLLQLLAEDPETMERLGEVPVAVVEKAKTCGGHNLSGAVMRPGPLGKLFPDMTREQWREEGFAFGEVTKESVYLLPSAKTKI